MLVCQWSALPSQLFKHSLPSCPLSTCLIIKNNLLALRFCTMKAHIHSLVTCRFSTVEVSFIIFPEMDIADDYSGERIPPSHWNALDGALVHVSFNVSHQAWSGG
jgi:hypothetical protein